MSSTRASGIVAADSATTPRTRKTRMLVTTNRSMCSLSAFQPAQSTSNAPSRKQNQPASTLTKNPSTRNQPPATAISAGTT